MTLPSSKQLLRWLSRAALAAAAVIGFLIALPFIVAMTFARERRR